MPTAPTLDEVALLAAIHAAPDEDTPRLLLADCLDELGNERVEVPCPKCKDSGEPGWRHRHGRNGPGYYACEGCADIDNGDTRGTGRATIIDTSRADRAELIRVQCELARIPVEPKQMSSCRLVGVASKRGESARHLRRCQWCQFSLAGHIARSADLKRRESAILKLHPEWFPPCPQCNDGSESAVVRYGFVGGEHCGLCSGTGRVGTFRRGFVHSVRVPTIASALEPKRVKCSRCEREGRVVTPAGAIAICPRCDGQGTVAGDYEPTPYATRLFAQWGTVREVVPVDRVPYLAGNGEFLWIHTDNAEPEQSTLCEPIWCSDIISEDIPGPFGQRRAKSFATPEAAVAAMGQALADTVRTKCHAAT